MDEGGLYTLKCFPTFEGIDWVEAIKRKIGLDRW